MPITTSLLHTIIPNETLPLPISPFHAIITDTRLCPLLPPGSKKPFPYPDFAHFCLSSPHINPRHMTLPFLLSYLRKIIPFTTHFQTDLLRCSISFNSATIFIIAHRFFFVPFQSTHPISSFVCTCVRYFCVSVS